MGQTKGGDPLLAIFGIGLRIYMGFTALLIVAVAAMMVMLLVAPPADITVILGSAPPALLPLILVCAGLMAAILALGILFSQQLLRIIQTVKNGDPFEPANANRLSRMAWYALAATVGSWLVGAIGPILERYFENTTISASPVGGLVLVVTLFVLARVFRHGAAMRDDLVGTV